MFYIQNNKVFNPTSSSKIVEQLEPAIYALKQDLFKNFFFEEIEPFKNPKKLYGDTNQRVSKIFRTFKDRSKSTGILASGIKGSGKSILARELAIVGAREHNLPTIVVNTPFSGESFNQLIQNVNQPAIILFDEFEKTYGEKEDQEALLTLLDGVYPTNKLFVFTVNDKYGVNRNMLNRPGRIFYAFEYKGITIEFVEEYCAENLNNISFLEEIKTIHKMVEEFTIDMLVSLCEETNRYDQNPLSLLGDLNIKFDIFLPRKYAVEIRDLSGKVFEAREKFVSLNLEQFRRYSDVFVSFYKNSDEDDADIVSLEPEIHNLIAFDKFSGTLTFQIDDYTVTLTPAQQNQRIELAF